MLLHQSSLASQSETNSSSQITPTYLVVLVALRNFVTQQKDAFYNIGITTKTHQHAQRNVGLVGKQWSSFSSNFFLMSFVMNKKIFQIHSTLLI